MAGAQQAPEGLALIFATISRPHTAQRLINSVRRYFPAMPVYVADQSAPDAEQAAFYEQNGCTVVWMEHDAGVCASRNAVLDLVKEPYFILCDDDFILGPQTDFTPALKILDRCPDIGVVGGRLFDVHDRPGGHSISKRFWELLFHYDRSKGKFLSIPVHYFAPDPQTVAGVPYYECDAVMNFAVFRRGMFDARIRWDPQFKSNGEHEDFYLNLKVNGQHRVVYCPDVVAYHNHPPLNSYGKMRGRTHGWQLFLRKWGLRQFLELEQGLRLDNMTGDLQPYAMGYEDFYQAAPLAPVRRQAPKDCLLVSNVSGQIVSNAGRLEETPPAEPPVSARISISLDGHVTGTGGRWQRVPGGGGGQTAAAAGKAAGFDVSWPESNGRGQDLFCYLRPQAAAEGDGTPRLLEGAEVLYSVAIGADYLIFRQPALAYGQGLVLGQWNAVALPAPLLAAELCVEVTVARDGKSLFECSRRFGFG